MQQELTVANTELQQLRNTTKDQKKEITRMQTSLESEKGEIARLQAELHAAKKIQNEKVLAKESEKVR
jgi:capsule polysaccharide export protein KpsE/RkpR